MTSLLIATRNRHKVAEIQAVLGTDFRFYSLYDFPEVPPVTEDQSTFVGNALKKARETARVVESRTDFEDRFPGPRAWVVADDSGLEVDALQGAPGVHSARFAAPDGVAGADSGNCPDADNNAKLLGLLQHEPLARRTARFRCVVACVQLKPRESSPVAQTFDGVCEGRIQFQPTGHAGFGYDPLFVPEGYPVSFAELDAETKNRLSHRFHAVEKLRQHLQTQAREAQSFANSVRTRSTRG